VTRLRPIPPLPLGEGGGEGEKGPVRALARLILPDADVTTAVGP